MIRLIGNRKTDETRMGFWEWVNGMNINEWINKWINGMNIKQKVRIEIQQTSIDIYFILIYPNNTKRYH